MKNFDEFMLQEQELDETAISNRILQQRNRQRQGPGRSAEEVRDQTLGPAIDGIKNVHDKISKPGEEMRDRLIGEPIRNIKNTVSRGIEGLKTPGADYSAGNPGLQKLKDNAVGLATSAMTAIGNIRKPWNWKGTGSSVHDNITGAQAVKRQAAKTNPDN